MPLALGAISAVLLGLLIRERGERALLESISATAADDGRRASEAGVLLAILSFPWVAIGIAVSHFS